jgi:hypothetical protein
MVGSNATRQISTTARSKVSAAAETRDDLICLLLFFCRLCIGICSSLQAQADSTDST